MSTTQTARPDVYSRITDKIIADLEQGVRTWLRPWNADHAAGRITRPLRHNGVPYKGINVIMLWSASVMKGHACPLWLTFRQAQELGGHVRKGETGELVVYACEIAPNSDPITEICISLILLMNLPSRWGHDWPRRITAAMPIF